MGLTLAFLETILYFTQSLGGRTLLKFGVYSGKTNRKDSWVVENHLSSNTSLIDVLISSKIWPWNLSCSFIQSPAPQTHNKIDFNCISAWS